jgi:hypothetical protein
LSNAKGAASIRPRSANEGTGLQLSLIGSDLCDREREKRNPMSGNVVEYA